MEYIAHRLCLSLSLSIQLASYTHFFHHYKLNQRFFYDMIET